MGGVLTVTLTATGLCTGTHGVYVHTYGDVSDVAAAANTGAQFVGNCTSCRCAAVRLGALLVAISMHECVCVLPSHRPVGVPQEVGALNDGVPLSSTAIYTPVSITFTDTVATLTGPNSILGRSIVLYGNGTDAGARVAQCVIGDTDDGPTEASGTQAMCTLTATAQLSAVGAANVRVGTVIGTVALTASNNALPIGITVAVLVGRRCSCV